MKRTIVALALSCLGVAHAEFRDGNKLLADLQGDIYDRMYAMGYIVGVADTGRAIVHCMPANATAGQINDMVKNYLENTPSERHQTGDMIVSRVLKAVWPCAKRGSSL